MLKLPAAPKTNSLSPAADPVVARVPFFYGWVMLPIAVVGQIATSPGQTYGISVFNEAFRRDLGLSHTELTGAYMLGTLLAALPVSYVGSLMDQYGIRRVMAAVVVLLGGTCTAISQVNGLLTLFCAFFFLRMLGQGALTLLSSNTLAMWFHARLGMASGLMSLGTAAAFAFVPSVNLYLLDNYGWRGAYVILGIGVWAVMLPLLAIFFRNRPEDVGLSPDGAILPDKAAAPPPLDKAFTLAEAARTRAYWILLSMNALWAMVGTAIVFCLLPLFESYGLGATDVTRFFTYFAASMAGAQFLGGLLADRLPLNMLLTLSMAGTTLSTVLLTRVDTSFRVAVFAVTAGAAQGVFLVLQQTVWARYFGRAHLGKIRGTIWTGCVAGSSVGPFAMGLSMDLTSSYATALWLFVVFYTVLTLAAPWATAPRLPA